MSAQRLELSMQQKIENVFFAMAMPIVCLAAIQWTITTWIVQWKNDRRKGRRFRPHLPRKITTFVTGGVPASDTILLRQWGISCANWTMWFTTDNEVVGLERSVLVSVSQWEFADAILSQNGAEILTEPGAKRKYKFTKPWGVGVKSRSFDEGINSFIGDALGSKHHGVANGKRKPAKLGKTYKGRGSKRGKE